MGDRPIKPLVAAIQSLQPQDVTTLEVLCGQQWLRCAGDLPDNVIIQSLSALRNDILRESTQSMPVIAPTFTHDEMVSFCRAVDTIVASSKNPMANDIVSAACTQVKIGLGVVRRQYEALSSLVDFKERQHTRDLEIMKQEFSLDAAGRLDQRQIIEKWWPHLAEEGVNKIDNPLMIGPVPAIQEMRENLPQFKATKRNHNIVLSALPILNAAMDQTIEHIEQQPPSRKVR